MTKMLRATALLLLSYSGALAEHSALRIRPDIAAAIKEGQPVVALESTIISHGMPFPANLETARAVEEIVAQNGAIPATVAVIDGECIVGLTGEELERFAQLEPACVSKCSRRDLAAVVARRGHGGTTVSATMLLAHLAGVPVFVTGGIGGVHRGGEVSMDVSADLLELGRTPLTVVCAGAKSILDIPRTLEVLETQGVAVFVLGSDEFPAFFTRSSGCAAPTQAATVLEIAQAIDASDQLQLQSGMLVGVPIPQDAEAEATHVQAAIEAALAEVESQGIGGRDVTPFLLKRVNELTGGASLIANIALIKNNAAVGASIAVELAQLRSARTSLPPPNGLSSTLCVESCGLNPAAADDNSVAAADVTTHTLVTHTDHSEVMLSSPPPLPPSLEPTKPAPVLQAFALPGATIVVGGSVADLVAYPATGTPLLPGTSTPGQLVVNPGGVGRNIAEGLSRLGYPPLLLSAVGDDSLADQLMAHAAAVRPALPMGSLLRVRGARTATFTALQDEHGELRAAVADMDVLGAITPEYISYYAVAFRDAPLCIADANLPHASLQCLARLALQHATPLWLEPVSVAKAAAASATLYHSGLLGAVDFVSPNEEEAVAMAAALHSAEPLAASLAAPPSDEQVIAAAAAIVHAGCKNVLVTRGTRGLLWARMGSSRVEFEHMDALPATVTSTRGAGDAFVAGSAWGLLQHSRDAVHQPDSLRAALLSGLRAAQLTVESEAAVAPTLIAEHL